MYLRSLLDYEPEWATQHEDTMEDIYFHCSIRRLLSDMRRFKAKRDRKRRRGYLLFLGLVMVLAISILLFAT